MLNNLMVSETAGTLYSEMGTAAARTCGVRPGAMRRVAAALNSSSLTAGIDSLEVAKQDVRSHSPCSSAAKEEMTRVGLWREADCC